MKKRILCLTGAWCVEHPCPVWQNIGAALRSYFPDAEIVIEEEHDLDPWEIARIQSFCDQLVEKYDDGTETLFVGHSLGGRIACAVAYRFKKTPVCGIVTIFSPHTFLGKILPQIPDAREKLNTTIVSFGARIDGVVLWGTHHPHETKHFKVWSRHKKSLIKSRQLARKIVRLASEEIFREVGW